MTNKLLLNLFPQLVEELQMELIASGELDLANQFPILKVLVCNYDEECMAGYIRVEPVDNLNVVEKNIMGAHHSRTLAVQHQCDIYLDVDNFDRITGIEILDGSAYAQALLGLCD
ncbi:hypothetical protein [Deefgea rivuli]|uniref:hypothetical protein n=1 Tax=Deefgea rivuli TaxID=400948 RepID=UPI000487FC8F|nr:hypothetical protein [Deefgea rivuli]